MMAMLHLSLESTQSKKIVKEISVTKSTEEIKQAFDSFVD